MLVSYLLLATALTHLGYIFVDSYLMRGYRDWMATLGPTAKELSGCIICTTTQLAILLCWLVGPLFPTHNPVAYLVSYLVSSLFLAKLSLLIGSLIEMSIYAVGALASLTNTPYYAEPQAPSENMDPIDTGL